MSQFMLVRQLGEDPPENKGIFTDVDTALKTIASEYKRDIYETKIWACDITHLKERFEKHKAIMIHEYHTYYYFLYF